MNPRSVWSRPAWLALLVSALISAAVRAQAPDLTIEPHRFETRSNGEVESELGKLMVPENRGRPHSRKIELAFVRLPSTAEQPGSPIVYLAGGPGGSGISAGQGSRFRLFQSLRSSGDVILLDQRGTGWSTRIDPEQCDEVALYPSSRPLELELYLSLAEEVAASCARFWQGKGVDLNAYNSWESAADIEVLRTALGVEQLDLLGISYGTHLAMTYIRRYPERVRRAVLAGAEGPDHTVKLPSQFDGQLDALEGLLAAQSGDVEEEVRGLVRGVLETLERVPVTLRITELEGPDREMRLVIGRRDVAAVTMSLLQDPESFAQIPVLYRRLAAGDFTDIADAVQDLRKLGGLEAMPEAMDAASGISPTRRARLISEDRTTLLGSGVLAANLAYARGLGVRDLGESFREPLASDVSTLFISGSLDGRTPRSNAEELMQGFSQATHLVIENGGHGNDLLLASPDLEQSILDFFLNRKLGSLRVSLPPPDLQAARVRAPLSPELATRYVGEYERREREIWRILHHKTIDSLDAAGEIRVSNAVLQIRWAGDGFPFHPVSETIFFIDFPWFIADDFQFDLDDSDRVTHLSFEDSEGQVVRMEKVH